MTGGRVIARYYGPTSAFEHVCKIVLVTGGVVVTGNCGATSSFTQVRKTVLTTTTVTSAIQHVDKFQGQIQQLSRKMVAPCHHFSKWEKQFRDRCRSCRTKWRRHVIILAHGQNPATSFSTLACRAIIIPTTRAAMLVHQPKIIPSMTIVTSACRATTILVTTIVTSAHLITNCTKLVTKAKNPQQLPKQACIGSKR